MRRIPQLLALFLIWQRAVNRFRFVRLHERLGQAEFRCLNFDPATRSCREYDLRPAFCRDHPEIDTWLARPSFLPACGFRPARAGEAEELALLDRLAESGDADPAAVAAMRRRIESGEPRGDLLPPETRNPDPRRTGEERP